MMRLPKMTSTKRICRAASACAVRRELRQRVCPLSAQDQPIPPAPKPPVPEQKQDSGASAQRGQGPAGSWRTRAGKLPEKKKMRWRSSSNRPRCERFKKLTGLNLQQSYWLSMVLNFVVIAAAIVWAARKYLPGLFRDRTRGDPEGDAGSAEGERRGPPQAGRDRVAPA